MKVLKFIEIQPNIIQTILYGPSYRRFRLSIFCTGTRNHKVAQKSIGGDCFRGSIGNRFQNNSFQSSFRHRKILKWAILKLSSNGATKSFGLFRRTASVKWAACYRQSSSLHQPVPKFGAMIIGKTRSISNSPFFVRLKPFLGRQKASQIWE